MDGEIEGTRGLVSSPHFAIIKLLTVENCSYCWQILKVHKIKFNLESFFFSGTVKLYVPNFRY